jgi:hypothetical protein
MISVMQSAGKIRRRGNRLIASSADRFLPTDPGVSQNFAHYARLVIENTTVVPDGYEWGKDGNDGKLYILQAS